MGRHVLRSPGVLPEHWQTEAHSPKRALGDLHFALGERSGPRIARSPGREPAGAPPLLHHAEGIVHGFPAPKGLLRDRDLANQERSTVVRRYTNPATDWLSTASNAVVGPDGRGPALAGDGPVDITPFTGVRESPRASSLRSSVVVPPFRRRGIDDFDPQIASPVAQQMLEVLVANRLPESGTHEQVLDA